MAKKKKEPKNKSVERKVYYYKVTCKCDGTNEIGRASCRERVCLYV